MNEKVQAQLRRLGVVKGTHNLKPSAPLASPSQAQGPGLRVNLPSPSQGEGLGVRVNLPSPSQGEGPGVRVNSDEDIAQRVDDDPLPLTQLLPGCQLEQTPFGDCLVLDHVYPAGYEHGSDTLDGLESRPVSAAATFTRDPRLSGLALRDALFLDTETTGLGGAGTIAFMVGLAFWDGGAFVVRQYFCRDYDDEPAMLWLLAQLAKTKSAVITFNGRSFDLPLLSGRYLLNRLDDVGETLFGRPHLDLLPPARRLWRSRLVSCSLHSLEERLLGVGRSEMEVPGWAIPGIYQDYLRFGDGRGVARVFYHNRMDMLSMGTLVGRVLRQFEQPQAWDDPLDLLSLAKWQVELDLRDEAEQILRQVANPQHPLGSYQEALALLGYLYKQSGRRTEAVQCWQQLAVTSLGDVSAHVELAKHYEWHEVDLGRALAWTRQALHLLAYHNQVGDGRLWAAQKAELEHRLTRLDKKASATRPSNVFQTSDVSETSDV